MNNEIKKIRNKLIMFQVGFLCCVVFACIALLSVSYVQKFDQQWKDELDQTAQYMRTQIAQKIVAQQKKHSLETIQGDLTVEEYKMITNLDAVQESTLSMNLQDIQEELIQFAVKKQNYSALIIDEYGSIVLDRENGKFANQDLWQGYQTKLIYEIKKQKEGWSNYPEIKKYSLDQKSYVLRYLWVKELKWIVIVEAERASVISLLSKNLDNQFYFIVCGIILFGIILIRLAMQFTFFRTERLLASAWEKRSILLNSKEAQLNKLRMRPVSSSTKAANISRKRRAEDRVKVEENFKNSSTNSEESVEAIKEGFNEYSKHIAKDVNQELQQQQLDQQPIEVSPDTKEQSPKQASVVAPTADESNVRLPLLQKLLSEMKNN